MLSQSSQPAGDPDDDTWVFSIQCGLKHILQEVCGRNLSHRTRRRFDSRGARTEEHKASNQTSWREAVWLLEPARRAQELFQKQEPREKWRLLNFVLANCTWKGAELQATVRQPFAIIIASTKACEQKKGRWSALQRPFED
jgi:hypothetical protein